MRRSQPRRDGMTPGQLRTVVAAIAVLHIAGGWALLQVPAVRDAVVEAAPIFVNFIAPPAPPKPPEPVPPPPPPKVPQLKKPPPPTPLVTAPPSPAPAPFVAPAPPPEPVAETPVPPPADPAPPPPPAPAAPAPKILPDTAVQYLVPPERRYPPMSQRLGETGRVMVRVYIGTQGEPAEVQVHKSSGFKRLDDEAVRSVRGARFKPYTENGRPTAGWAFIPMSFDLEK